MNPAIALLLFFPSWSGAPLIEQDPPPDERPDRIERLEAWPEVPKELRSQVKTDIQRLRKAHTEGMGEQARDALLAVGTPAAEGLIAALGKEKDEEAIARIVFVLDRITDARCTRLIAESFDARSQHLRTWALFRVAAFPDAGTLAAAEKALKRAEKVKDPGKDDRVERLGAALCVTAAGSPAALEVLIERAPKDWGEFGARFRVALEAVRGPEATEIVAKGLEGDRVAKIAALNLLSGCGDLAAAGRVKPLLDDTDNSIRVAAINALRGIVDGDPPLDKLPVFEAIEVANKWKSRV